MTRIGVLKKMSFHIKKNYSSIVDKNVTDKKYNKKSNKLLI